MRKDVVEPAYKALLLKVDAMIERTAAANAKHSNLSRVETRYFLARRLKQHTKSPRLQAYAAKCRAASDDASKAYATAMMDNAFPKASSYFDARSRGAATSAKGFDAARSEIAKAEKALRNLAERLDKHVAARGDDALRGMLRGVCVWPRGRGDRVLRRFGARRRAGVGGCGAGCCPCEADAGVVSVVWFCTTSNRCGVPEPRTPQEDLSGMSGGGIMSRTGVSSSSSESSGAARGKSACRSAGSPVEALRVSMRQDAAARRGHPRREQVLFVATARGTDLLCKAWASTTPSSMSGSGCSVM